MAGDHSRSLKMLPFESLNTVSYLPFMVTMAVSLAISEIFSIIVFIEYRNVTDRQTDGRTDRGTGRQICYIIIARQCADACSKRRSLLIARDDDEMFMTRSLNVTPKTTE